MTRPIFISSLLSLLSIFLPCSQPLQAQGQGDFVSRERQLTFEGKRSGEGYFNPNGSKLIFQSERDPQNPFYQIYSLSFLTGETQRVSPGIGKTTCAFFHPSGKRILFGSTHLDPEAVKKQKEELDFRSSGKKKRYSWDYDENMDIFASSLSESNRIRLTDARGYDAEAGYSPDGLKIVFCSTRGAYQDGLSAEELEIREIDLSYFGEIYIMNSDGSDQKRLTFSPGYDGGPFFSPDGTQIVWRRFDKSGARAEIYTMNCDGTNVKQITDLGMMSWAPFYHPTGKYIVFSSNKYGFENFELFLVDTLGTSSPIRITEREGFDGLPVFSPNGQQLCWTSNATADNSSQIFLANWNHEAALSALGEKTVTKEVLIDQTGDISIADLTRHVSYLASDELEGRQTGSEGIRKAADYIKKSLRNSGLLPLNQQSGSFEFEFEFTGGFEIEDGKNALSFNGLNIDLQLHLDFVPLSFSASGLSEGEVVFAGYGLSKPGNLGIGYDSYKDLDLKDKFALVLRFVPEDVSQERRLELNRYSGLRYKAIIAKQNGAKGLLVVTGPNSPGAGTLAKTGFDTSLADAGIPVISISGSVANQLLAPFGKSLKELQTSLDAENPHASHGMELQGLQVKSQVAIQRKIGRGKNILAVILPSGIPAEGKTMEYVMLGAHYDHLGRGEGIGMGIKGEENEIHNGADDNASGVAALLEIAGSLAERRKSHPEEFKRGVVFGFWSGEELGLIGSSRFVANPTIPLEEVVAYLNFDMVGRLRNNKLTLQGTGSSGDWDKLIERRNILAGFDITLQKDPYLPTDSTSFYPKGIPILAWFTGSHKQYHRPGDDTETLNFEGLKRISDFASSIALDLAKSSKRPSYLKVSKKDLGGSRDAIRIFLGTIPDYASEEVSGVLLSGVREGGPADLAGLKSGDVIIQLGESKITTIYDYTFALDALKVNQPTTIVILRNKEKLELSITPLAR